MRIRATVRRASGSCLHIIDKPFVPAWLEIHDCGDGGYSLNYLDANGESLTDTWHETIEDAKAMASEEFAIEESDWRRVPDESDGPRAS